MSVATEAARATALVSRGASFIVSSRGSRKTAPLSQDAAVTPLILRSDIGFQTGRFHGGTAPRGPHDSAAPRTLAFDR